MCSFLAVSPTQQQRLPRVHEGHLHPDELEERLHNSPAAAPIPAQGVRRAAPPERTSAERALRACGGSP